MATYKFKGPDGKTYRFSRQGDATPAPETPTAPKRMDFSAEKPNMLKEVGKIALETPLRAAGLAKQGLTGLGVAAQRAIEGKSNLDRTADAVKPGFVPESGEKIGAFLGPTVPALATGNIPAAMAIAGSTKAGERLNAGDDLGDAAQAGAIDAAVTGATSLAVPGALSIAGNLSSKMAQKSFGFSSAAIRRLGLGKVKDIATTLAKEKVIDPLGRRAVTLQRVDKLLGRTGEKIGEILDNSQAVINPNDVAMEMANKLLPKAKGPLYDKAAKVAEEVVDTITALGEGNVPLRSIHDLRKVIAGKARFNSMTDSEASELFEKAYGVLSDYMEKSIDKVSPELRAAYKDLNKVFSAAKEGSDAIGRRVASSEAAEPGVTLGVGSLLKDAASSAPGIASRAAGAPVVKEASDLARGLVNPARRITRAGSSQLVNSMLEDEPKKRKEK